MSKNHTKSIALIIGVFTLSLTIGYMVLAWTEPTLAPPDGNVSAPINVGIVGQSKAGGLILNTGGAESGLLVHGISSFDGSVGIGDADPQAKLHIGGTAGTDGIIFPDGTLQTTAASGGGGGWSFISNTGGSFNCYECSASGIVPIPAGTKYIIGDVGGYTSEGGTYSYLVNGSIFIVVGSKNSATFRETFETSGLYRQVTATVNGNNVDLSTNITGVGGSTGYVTYNFYFYQ